MVCKYYCVYRGVVECGNLIVRSVRRLKVGIGCGILLQVFSVLFSIYRVVRSDWIGCVWVGIVEIELNCFQCDFIVFKKYI